MSGLLELASGVDSLYVSGRCELPVALLEDLEANREQARQDRASVAYQFGGYDFELRPGPLNNHKYRLDHPVASIGFSPSEKLPPIFVQFRAEAIHSAGTDGVLRWLRTALLNEGIDTKLQVSRIDLHADWQHWDLTGDQRKRFVCRSRSLATYEEGPELSGFSFGNRKSKTITARIYDKTNEVRGNGHDWWHDVWGPAFDKDVPVLRVEFEFARNALREMDLHDPTTTLDNVDRLWAYATQEWLTYRRPTPHSCAFRWPISTEWAQVQKATLAGSAVPIDRITLGRTNGELRRILPGLNGYIASFGALTGNDDIDAACDAVKDHLRGYEHRSRRSFCDRTREKRRKLQ